MNTLSLTPTERFVQDLLDSGHSYEVTLNSTVARELLAACHNNLVRLGPDEYKRARNEALEDALIVGTITANEWNAYKDFIDRRFQRRAKETIKLKFRSFAPLHAHEDGH